MLRGLSWSFFKPSTPYHSFTHAKGCGKKKEGFFRMSIGGCCHLSQFSSFQLWLLQCNAPLLPLIRNEVSWENKRAAEWYTSLWECAGDIITACCLFIWFLGWAWLLSPESLNTLQGLWEIQRRRTSQKLLHVLRTSVLLSLNSENKEKKVGSCEPWFSRCGKSLYVDISISIITYWLSDVAVSS